MSTQRQHGDESDDATEQLVVGFLQRHPDFLQQHPGLLTQLHLNHACGPAVSLIEHQVDALRRQNRQLHAKLMDLVAVARDNDRTGERLHRLTIALLDAGEPEEIVQTLAEVLHEQFGADAMALKIITDHLDAEALRPYVVSPGLPAVAACADLLAEGKPVCGRLKAAQREFLFGDRAEAIASAALIPITTHRTVGLLAVGSTDPERFLLTMGTVYLTRLGELVGQLLRPLLPMR